jgi:hypothetical protein
MDGSSLPKCISATWDRHREVFIRVYPGVHQEWTTLSKKSPEEAKMKQELIQNCPYLKRISDSARSITPAAERQRIAAEMCGCIKKSGVADFSTKKFNTIVTQCLAKAINRNEAGFRKAYPNAESGKEEAWGKMYSDFFINCAYMKGVAEKQRQAAMPDTTLVLDTLTAKKEIAGEVCACAEKDGVTNLSAEKDLKALNACIDKAWNYHPGKARSAYPRAYSEFKNNKGFVVERERMYFELVSACPALEAAMKKRYNTSLPETGLQDGSREDRQAITDEVCACTEKGRAGQAAEHPEKLLEDCLNASRLADSKRFRRAHPSYNGGRAYDSRLYVDVITKCPALLNLMEEKFESGRSSKGAINRDSLQYVMSRDTANLVERKFISNKICACTDGSQPTEGKPERQLITCFYQVYYAEQTRFIKAYGDFSDEQNSLTGQKVGFDIARWCPQTIQKIRDQKEKKEEDLK